MWCFFKTPGRRGARASKYCAAIQSLVASVADSLDFERKNTSTVTAWGAEDQWADAQIEAVLERFEKTAWVGLEPDRYAWTAVLAP